VGHTRNKPPKDGFEAAGGRRTNRPGHIAPHPARIDAVTARTEAAAAHGHGRVSARTDVRVRHRPRDGIRIAVRAKDFSEYVTEHLPGFVEGGGEDEGGVADAY